MKKTTNTLAAAIAAFIALGMSAIHAQNDDDDGQAAAAKLMNALELEEQMKPALDGVTQMQEAMLGERGDLTDKQKETARDLYKASMEEVEKVIAWESIVKIFVDVYAKVFTVEELNHLTAMFESETGKVYVKKQGALQAATMQEMQKIMLEVMPKVHARAREAIEKAKADGNF